MPVCVLDPDCSIAPHDHNSLKAPRLKKPRDSPLQDWRTANGSSNAGESWIITMHPVETGHVNNHRRAFSSCGGRARLHRFHP